MGFNTGLVICNDAFSEIDSDPAKWWTATKTAISRAEAGAPVEYGFGSYANGFWAASNQNANVITLLAIGGNYPSVVFQEQWGNRGHHSHEDQVDLIRRAAGQLGYTLIKKTTGKRKPKSTPKAGGSDDRG
jgi:hypothetical protein